MVISVSLFNKSSHIRPTHKLECRAPVPVAPLALTDGTGQNIVQVEFLENLRQAELGNALAQFCVAMAFYDGCGVLLSVDSAHVWAERSARQGFTVAQGYCALHGVGVPENERRAFKLLKETALAGVREAQCVLGTCFEFGYGTAVNFKEAARCYRLAADQGYATAQFNVGSFFDNRTGVTQDAREAVKWYQLAAEQGYANAQYNLGFSYRSGTGVPQDAREAVRWFRLAAEQRARHGAMQSCCVLLQRNWCCARCAGSGQVVSACRRSRSCRRTIQPGRVLCQW